MFNRFIAFIYIISAVIAAGCKSNTVRISGTLTDPVAGEYLLLEEFSSDKLKAVDSVKMSNDGSFDFRREVKTPLFLLLKFNNNNFTTLLVEPGEKIFLKAHHDSLNYPRSVEGSRGTGLMASYNRQLSKTITRIKSLNKIYTENLNKPGLPEIMDSLDSLAQGYMNELNAYTKQYIDSNINSLVSLVALYQQVAPGVYVLDPSRDWKYYAKVDSSMFRLYPDYDPVITLHDQVKKYTEKLQGEEGVIRTGVTAPEIILPNPEGDTIKLSSTRGSVVLVDFWASWCPPCRLENPNLVKAYDKWHKRGFQIFQVSLDKTREAWLKGIEDDQLGRWIHVSDIQYWNSVVVPLYKIESIPSNFLLDRQGNIIGVNLRGDRLETKLAEIFTKR
ncbi:MAG TPA: TlpA disulfide reductase family protein [Bacteroidales bacterium]|nr:TlpA disulfide reductase family protein [Bacteroidales bacterium]